MMQLATIYEQRSDNIAAIRIYNGILNMSGADVPLSYKMGAAQNAAMASFKASQPPKDQVYYLDALDNLVAEARAAGDEYAKGYDFAVEVSDVQRYRAYRAAATVKAATSKTSEMLQDTMNDYTEAVKYLDSYLAKVKQYNDAELERMNFTREAMLVEKARVLNAMAETSAKLDGQASLALRMESAEAAFQELSEDPKGKFSQNAASIAAQQLQYVASNNEYVTRLIDAMEKVAPGHEVLTAIVAEASRYGYTGASEGSDPAKSDRLYEAVILKEREWFPGQFASHVNFQEALLGRLQIALQKKDPIAAAEFLTQLKVLKLRGDYLQSVYDKCAALFESQWGTFVSSSPIQMDSVIPAVGSEDSAFRNVGGKPNMSTVATSSVASTQPDGHVPTAMLGESNTAAGGRNYVYLILGAIIAASLSIAVIAWAKFRARAAP